uniref:Structure-specific endonuclease subunit SLX1 C-terminal domain-containing protein n=1 Tax=Oncorhynchus tshawytscha TaxID=74940 RepID=A0AAZ3NV43_ONCTS
MYIYYGLGGREFIRGVHAVLHQSQIQGSYLHWFHCESGASYRTAQRRATPRWSQEDQWKGTLVTNRTNFEWAWQNPHSSRRLSHVTRRSKKESSLQFHWRVVSNMLRVMPWSRLPLTTRWLKQEYRMDFEPGLQPPLHVPLAFGSIRARKQKPKDVEEEQEEKGADICLLCQGTVKSADKMTCFHPLCHMTSHVICLAKHFLTGEAAHLLPVEGECPGCHHSVLWGSLIRHKNGCYGDLEKNTSSSQNHWTDELQL